MQKEFIGSALLHGGLIVAALIWMGLPVQDDAPAEGSVVVDIISNSLVTSNLSERIESDASEDMVLSGSEIDIAAVDDAPVIEPIATETVTDVTEAPQPLPAPRDVEPIEVMEAIEAPEPPSAVVEALEQSVVMDVLEAVSAPEKLSPDVMTLAALEADRVEVASLAPMQASVEGAEIVETAVPVMPTPRPTNLEEIRAQALPPPPVRQAPRPTPQQAGNGGNSTQNSAAAQSSGGQAGAGSGGNADIARYPGQVERKVARLLRYPNGANGARGEAHVNFTLDASGGLIRLGLGRSSGNDVLDQAALAIVQRAAPFPAFPAGTARNQWDFSIPLAFSR